MNYVIYYCLTTSTGITKNMKKIIVLIVCSISFISCSPEKKSERTPNIIYFLADDLGYGELGVYGQ